MIPPSTLVIIGILFIALFLFWVGLTVEEENRKSIKNSKSVKKSEVNKNDLDEKTVFLLNGLWKRVYKTKIEVFSTNMKKEDFDTLSEKLKTYIEDHKIL